MAGKYVKCPRCELNYIDSTKQEYCDVCLAELKLGPQLKFADIEDDEDAEALELCPVCKQNYIKYNEDICEECKKKQEFEDDVDINENDESWREYLDPDTEEEEGDMSLSELEMEEAEEFDDDDEFNDDYVDGGMYDTDDDLDDITDEDFDEDDLGDEDDDDDDDEDDDDEFYDKDDK